MSCRYREQGNDRTGEEAETLAVIVVTVEGITLEVVLVVHEVPDHAVLVQTEQTAVHTAPAQRHFNVADESHLILPVVRHLLVEGKDHLHIIAGSSKSLRKAACHVGKTAGFAKRNSLGCSKKNFHRKKVLLFII